MQETWVQSLGQEDPLEKEWLPILVFLPGEFHGQRSLVVHEVARTGHVLATNHHHAFLKTDTDN